MSLQENLQATFYRSHFLSSFGFLHFFGIGTLRIVIVILYSSFLSLWWRWLWSPNLLLKTCEQELQRSVDGGRKWTSWALLKARRRFSSCRRLNSKDSPPSDSPRPRRPICSNVLPALRIDVSLYQGCFQLSLEAPSVPTSSLNRM